MKSLSLKLDDKVFDDTEAITKAMKVARNRYINDALELYNKFNQRLLLEKQIKKEEFHSLCIYKNNKQMQSMNYY